MSPLTSHGPPRPWQLTTANSQYIQLASEQYGETVEPYRQAVIEAMESLDSFTDQQPTANDTDDFDNSSSEPPVATTATSDTSQVTDTAEEDSLGEFESSEFGTDRD